MHPMHFEPAARLPPKQKGPVQSMLQEVRETRVREGPLEVVTLQVVTMLEAELTDASGAILQVKSTGLARNLQ